MPLAPTPARTSAIRLGLVAAWIALAAGCASTPPSGGGIGRLPASASPDRDGPHPDPPADLERVPDAEPRLEPLRTGGPNKPYEVLGQRYTPITSDTKVVERGLASWYGRKFHGRPTASGEPYDMHAMTAAHPRLPIPSYARVRNPANGREVIVRINDRGPFHSGRIVDLSYTAALKLGLLRGVGVVELERLTQDEIRTGSWRREGTAVAVATPTPSTSGTPASGEPAPMASPTAAVALASDGATAAPQPDAPGASGASASAASEAPPAPAAVALTHASGFWVQLGAFRERASALSLQQRVMRELSSLVPSLAVSAGEGAAPHRVQAGPYPSRDEAARAARQLSERFSLSPRVVERPSVRR